MKRKPRTDAIVGSIREQHVPLPVAAHYVRMQLAADPLAIYDPQHFIDLIDLAGAALVSVAPLYTLDPGCAMPRRLTESELEDARVTRAAMVLVLRDGRTLSCVSIKRSDLRQAAVALKAAGIPELQRPAPPRARGDRGEGRVTMAPRKKASELADRLRGEHLGLCVAAHLARTQLVPDPFARHDGEHLLEMVEAVARALARVAPLYVRDAAGGDPRELTPADLEGAKVLEGGNLLLLRDGRRFTSMTIKRIDLRQAIAILKATGVPELQGNGEQPPAPARKEMAPTESPLATLARIEALVHAPLVPQQVAEANKALVFMARHSEEGRVANLAMQVMSALHESREDRVALLVPQLRSAVEETVNGQK